MSKLQGRQAQHTKSLNLALQGGGSHGAFTWGVLDRMFEDGRIWIDAISGTSAGAMNAVVAAQGMYDGGGEGARRELERFWRTVSDAGRHSPLRRTWLDQLTGNWSLDNSPGYLAADILNRLASPYETNPLQVNPLRDLVGGFIDFAKVQDSKDMPIYISATNVETGRARVFARQEITLDVVMASACLPFMFHAVMIDGAPYWDGGYMGNPVLFPLIEGSGCADIAIVQINPVVRRGTPRTARDILNRVNEITFNASMLKDLASLELIHRLVADGKLAQNEFRDMRIHIIEANDAMVPLGASSKMNTEWAFLTLLRDIGRRTAGEWLDRNFEQIGVRTTVDLPCMFGTRPGGAVA
jgi:NTE family protein